MKLDAGELELVPLDPQAHGEVVHGWVTMPRNRFWGMGDYTLAEVREVYAFLAGLDTHHAYLIELDGEPVGIFPTYEPAHDPVGALYPVEDGDIGMHLLLAPGRLPPRGFTAAVTPALVRFQFADPGRSRMVVEPDVRNHFAVDRMRREGFTFGPEISLSGKRAQLAFLTRARFEADYPDGHGVPS